MDMSNMVHLPQIFLLIVKEVGVKFCPRISTEAARVRCLSGLLGWEGLLLGTSSGYVCAQEIQDPEDLVEF